MDVLFKYYDLKKELLELDELHLYDIYTKIVKDFDKKYTFFPCSVVYGLVGHGHKG